ncbi:benzene/toluene dioxygenase ferredoxin subunit [Streptomyces sp. LamerLS-316]|uniref:Rieske (2Fe-2S) protein n=1 Tax=unclassified Streptomyces TaxID=2593676 RepID=UPI000823F259|nr:MULTISPECIES: Rieske 2Fe-2S domain-containing protein [unclassified Streptomyces]MYQ36931.1 Rieske 2Fe-2S domain-containing protein [Streptomyces sp. SID4921]SCK51899.1 benzene/toluene dioxygenase ferredoxin subunit [Streptomyces sp. LamerLS-316]
MTGDANTTARQEGSALVAIGPVSRFLRDGERVVTRAGDHEILTLACDGEIFAVGNRCTHRPWRLEAGRLRPEACEIECTLHLGRFSLRSGTATEGPPGRPLPVYDVEVIDDIVHVRVPVPSVS